MKEAIQELRAWLDNLENMPARDQYLFTQVVRTAAGQLKKVGCSTCPGKAQSTETASAPAVTKVSEHTETTLTGRPSCLLCAEKHLGAALVKYEEAKFGYRYRLLILGHLNEVEEETVTEYPDFAAKVRAARLSYQETGTLGLQGLVQELEVLRAKAKEASKA